jgi:hypothetical protein
MRRRKRRKILRIGRRIRRRKLRRKRRRIRRLERRMRRRRKKSPWSESASELYRPSDRRLSAKCLPTFADRECHVVSVTNPYGRILDFLNKGRYFSIK